MQRGVTIWSQATFEVILHTKKIRKYGLHINNMNGFLRIFSKLSNEVITNLVTRFSIILETWITHEIELLC